MATPNKVYRDAGFSAWLAIQPAPIQPTLYTGGSSTWANPTQVYTQLTDPPSDEVLLQEQVVRLMDLTRIAASEYFGTTLSVRLNLRGLVDTREFGILLSGMFGLDLNSTSTHNWLPGQIAVAGTTLGQIQPLISAIWTFGSYDAANNQWECYRMYDGRVMSLVINPTDGGPATFSASIEGNIYYDTAWTSFVAHPSFTPPGIAFERSHVVYSRGAVGTGSTMYPVFPVLPGSTLNFQNIGNAVEGTLRTTSAGPTQAARRTEGDIDGNADILYQSRTDMDLAGLSIPAGILANQSIIDYLSRTRKNWGIVFTEPTLGDTLEFRFPRMVYNSGTGITANQELAVQHLIGGMEKERLNADGGPSGGLGSFTKIIAVTAAATAKTTSYTSAMT